MQDEHHIGSSGISSKTIECRDVWIVGHGVACYYITIASESCTLWARISLESGEFGISEFTEEVDSVVYVTDGSETADDGTNDTVRYHFVDESIQH